MRLTFYANQRYQYKLYLDGLPSATVYKNPEGQESAPVYKEGIPVGGWDGKAGKHYINNHLEFIIKV